VFTNIKSVVGL